MEEDSKLKFWFEIISKGKKVIRGKFIRYNKISKF